jgi:hypothetical protein
LSSCRVIIRDEVNIKIEGLPVEVRRKLVNELKYDLPYARHLPAYRLGRWDGTKTFFGIGGSGYLAHLDRVLPIVVDAGYEIEVEDQRQHHQFKFIPITEHYWADQGKVWPKGHTQAGQPIVLRDYQYDVVNKFLENPQALQEVATGAGKTITTATLSHLCEPYGRTMVIVPNKSLVVQTEEDYRNLGLDVGVYFGDRKELNKTHTICTWQSLNVLDKKSYDSDTLTLAEFCEGVVALIVDECFDGDTLITTPQGKIPIKHLKAGDKVINLCEKTKQYKEDTVVKVQRNLSNSKSEKMLELEFDNGIKTQVTANHKFLTNKGWVRADELTDDLEVIDIKTQDKIRNL